MTSEQTEYLIKLKKLMIQYHHAHVQLVNHVLNDYQGNLDANDFIAENYPFEHSLDDYPIKAWHDSVVSKVNEKI